MIDLPAGTPVLDLTIPAGRRVAPPTPWSIGRYDEVRVDMYVQELFAGGRCVHMGIDLGAPPGTEVRAPLACEIAYAAVNPAPGDYGPTVVLRLLDVPLWVLVGHLSRGTLEAAVVGRRLQPDEVLGFVGDTHENGGWPPHIHVQLCIDDPGEADLPGAVTLADRESARSRFPDPRRLLGPLY